LKFEFEVAFEIHTKIILYDAFGNAIETLYDETMKPGVYSVHKEVSKLPTGVYFIRMTSGIFNEVQHFVKAE
jgi:hypothetical protein